MNIIVHNIKESNRRNKEDRIQDDRELLSNIFSKINVRVDVQDDIKFMTRIGRKPDNGCRPLLIGLKESKVRDNILDNSYKLVQCDEPFCEVNLIPDLTQIQRREEKEMRDDAKKRNEERAEEDRKNFQWKVVGRKGMSRLVKAAPLQENQSSRRDQNQPRTRRQTKS